MIGVRMVIADHVHILSQRSAFRPQGVIGGDDKTVVLLLRLASINNGENRRHAGIALRVKVAKERTAAFVGIGLFPFSANQPGDFLS